VWREDRLTMGIPADDACGEELLRGRTMRQERHEEQRLARPGTPVPGAE
jgi:hypothetical protein